MYRPTSKKAFRPQTIRYQSGAALVVSLIILLVMTVIGISNLQNTTFEEKMTGNVRDKAIAFEAGEAALREAEAFIENNVSTLAKFDSDGSDGFYNNNLERIWEVVDWSGSDSNNPNKAVTASSIDGAANPPKYVIQYYANYSVDEYNQGSIGQGSGAGEVKMFRITVRGTGGSDNATVVLQSTYGKIL